jgi:hypothetical protein
VLVGIFALAIFASDRSKQSMCPIIALRHKISSKFDPDQISTSDGLWPPQLSELRIFEVLPNLWAASMNASARMIMELNIKHYRELLKNETDASKRQVISKLLSEEQAQLKLLTRKEMDK